MIEFAGLKNICEVWHHAFMFVVLCIFIHIYIGDIAFNVFDRLRPWLVAGLSLLFGLFILL